MTPEDYKVIKIITKIPVTMTKIEETIRAYEEAKATTEQLTGETDVSRFTSNPRGGGRGRGTSYRGRGRGGNSAPATAVEDLYSYATHVIKQDIWSESAIQKKN